MKRPHILRLLKRITLILFLISLPTSALALAGDLDPSFGIAGRMTTDLSGGPDEIHAMILQPDGKILVAGTTRNGTQSDFALARYLPDGTPDAAFGSNGKTTVDFFPLGPGISQDDVASALALQPDLTGGFKIVVAGTTTYNGRSDFALARFLSDGNLDTIFNGGGRVTTNLQGGTLTPSQDVAHAIVIDASGNMIVGGYTWSTVALDTNPDFALVRYRPDGSVDNTFATGGLVITDFNTGEDSISALALQSDGKIIAVGISNYDFALVRYCADGKKDNGVNCGPGFGTQGKATTAFGGLIEEASSVVIQPDGKIVVAGSADASGSSDFALVRYCTDGKEDNGVNCGPGFGTGGKVITDFGGTSDGAYDLALQNDGKIYLAGHAGEDFALARYDSNGAPDLTFNQDGKTMADFFGAADLARAMALLPDGTILLAGSATEGTNKNFALARFQGGTDPLPPPSGDTPTGGTPPPGGITPDNGKIDSSETTKVAVTAGGCSLQTSDTQSFNGMGGIVLMLSMALVIQSITASTLRKGKG